MPTVSELFQAAAAAQRAGRFDEAAELYRHVVRTDARHSMAWHQLGCLAFYKGQYELAIEYLTRAIRLDGRKADFHHNLGSCCRALGRLNDARASYERALSLDPNDLITRGHLTIVLYALGARKQADRSAEDTLARPRKTPEEHVICSYLLLLRGDFLEGWAENEWRLEAPPLERRGPRETQWHGESLEGRSILVYGEQGLGDTLQFVRYVNLVMERGGRPVLAVQKELIPLLVEANFGPVVRLEGPWPDCHRHVPLGSLPWVFRTSIDNMPAKVPYIRAQTARAALWRERLAMHDGFRIGINWQGSTTYKFDRTRSIPLAEFAPLARVPGARLYSLQKNFGSEQLATIREEFEVIDLGAELDSDGAFVDTAAVIENLDLVITSDTATAHLAGAVGAKTWVALSTMPDFRWMLDRDDSPWYPSMRLYRQRCMGDWSSVFKRIADDLAALVVGQ